MDNIFKRFFRWLVFSVIIALLPILFNLFWSLTEGISPNLYMLLSRGELLVISAVISAAAVGELVGSGKTYLIGKYFSVGGCILVLISASGWFAFVSSKLNLSEQYSTELVAIGSLFIFIFAVLSGGSSIILSEAKE